MSIQASPMRSPPRRGAGPRDREQVIVGAGIEQGVFGQRARRDEADHVAPHDALGAALLGFGRVFGLLADRDAVAGAISRCR